MLFFVFRLLLAFALLGFVSAWDPCRECTPPRPHACCEAPSGRCCWLRKRRDLEPIDIKPLDRKRRDLEPIDIEPLDRKRRDIEPIDIKPLE